MNRLKITATALFASTLVFAVASAPEADWGRSSAPLKLDPTYTQECGACHTAYIPGLLPQRSWKAIMGNLGDHFGDDASLDAATQAKITDYLVQNAAESGTWRRSGRMLDSIPADKTPLRISETWYMKRKHHEIDPRWITANPQIKTMANCLACHPGAETGNFNEDNVVIPGRWGRWEGDDD